MAEIDNTVALGVKPQPQQDIIGPITSLANLQYLQAQGALAGANAQFKQGEISSLDQYDQLRRSGVPDQDALVQSGYNARNPAAGNAILGNLQTSTDITNRQNYAKTGDPRALASSGAPAVSDAVKANVDTQSYNMGLQIGKASNDLQLQKAGLMGNVASGVLALGDVNQQMPQGGIPRAVRDSAVSQALSMGLIDQQHAAQERQMSDGDFWNVAKQWNGFALGAKDGAVASGRQAAAEAAGTQSNTPHVLDTTQGIAAPPPAASLPASGVSVPQVQGAILGQESANRSNVGTSIDGAQGPGQILPSTFKAYAKPGESITNPADNRAVSGRIIADYMQRYNGDPARVSVAYFSGPGNVSPPGSPVPWKNNSKDGNGKYVSEYVHDMAGRLGGPASALPQPGAAAPGAGLPAPLQAAAALPFAPAATPQSQPGVNPLAPAPPAPGTVAPIAGAAPPPGAVAFNPTTGRYLTPATANRDGSPAPPIATAQGVVQDNAAGTANIAARTAAPAAAPAAPPAPGGSQWITPPAMNLSRRAELEGQGHAYGELPAQLDTAASSAKRMNTTLDEVTQAANGSWQSGKWAPAAENLREGLQSVANGLGIQTPGLDKSISSYQDFVKMAGNISRAAAHETSSQVGVQEMELINKSLPSPEVSDGGIKLIVPQMKGLNDFSIAKQQAASAFRSENGGSLGPSPKYGGNDFQTFWNANASPAAFVLHRMAQDNPQGARDLLMTMKSEPNGTKALKNIADQTRWAHDAGLLN